MNYMLSMAICFGYTLWEAPEEDSYAHLQVFLPERLLVITIIHIVLIICLGHSIWQGSWAEHHEPRMRDLRPYLRSACMGTLSAAFTMTTWVLTSHVVDYFDLDEELSIIGPLLYILSIIGYHLITFVSSLL